MIHEALTLLVQVGSVTELRLLRTPGGTVSGYFDNIDLLGAEAEKWNGNAPGVYITLNPVNPQLLCRAINRTIKRSSNTTADADIVKRVWLPMDFDPLRPSGISSTDAEHSQALARARTARDWLLAEGWPEPLLADSGNGAHLLNRIDLPNDEVSRDLLRRCLEALHFLFGDQEVAVDTTTYNAARIWKVYGTLACKGDSTGERPHRMARIIDRPSSLHPVSVELLERLAARCPAQPRASYRKHKRDDDFDVEAWLERHEVPVVASGSWNGGRKFIINPCPWNPEHTNRAAYVVQLAGGQIAAGCHHNGCADNDWHRLRRHYEGESDGPERAAGYEIGIRLCDVQAKPVEWLWSGRIPLGKLTIVDGDPGLGKSILMCDLAAHVTSGTKWPDGTECKQAGVVILSVEDDPEDTIRPRIDAAGGNPKNVLLIQTIPTEDGDSTPTIPRDLEDIREAILAVGASLLIIDPLMAYLGGETNSWRDQDVRRALAPLAKLARETGVAVVVVRHLNKGGTGNPMYRGGGSIGIIGAARAGFLVAPAPADPEQRVLAPTKSNLGIMPPSWLFTLEISGENYHPHVKWLRQTDLTADDLLSSPEDGEKNVTERSRAGAWLRELLQNGPRPEARVEQLAKSAGISMATLRRAKKDLGVVSDKEAFGAPWIWRLPSGDGGGGARNASSPGTADEVKTRNISI